MAKATLIYNPAAGRFPAGPLLQRAKRVLAQGGWTVRVVDTHSRADLVAAAREAVRRGDDAVFVAGGDGSVGTVAAELAGSKTALGVLPAGTANVWAREQGLPRLDWVHWFALESAASRLSRGTVRYADIGECNGKRFLLWAGVGLDGEIVNHIEPRQRWEKALATAHYATLALWNTVGWDGVDLKVRAPGVEVEGRFLIAVASNIRAYAGGLLELAPEARIDDGKLDFWLLGGQSVRDVVVRLLQVWRGTHVSAPGVVHFQAAEATFYAQEQLPIQLDGEPFVTHSPVHFRVHRRALRVLVPADSARLFSEA